MKKTITLSLLFLLGFSLFGQNKNSLNSRIFEGYEENFYFYNENGLLDSLYNRLVGDNFEKYSLYFYDEFGRNTRKDTYQNISSRGGWTHANRVDYTYDEEGRLSTRMNYNSFVPGEFTLGGKMIWSYNEKGLIYTIETYLASRTNPGEFTLLSKELFTYNDKDQLLTKEYFQPPYGSTDPDEMALLSKQEFSYTNDFLTSIVTLNYMMGMESSSSRQDFVYDENGNLIEFSSFLGKDSKNPQSRNIFHYNTDKLNAETDLPFNHEDSETLTWVRALKSSPNIIVKEEVWQIPAGEEQLEYLGDYIYSYSSDTHITTPLQDGIMNVMPSMAGDLLMLRGLPEGAEVELFDVSGQHLMSTRYDSQGIDLSALPRGTYMAYSKAMGCFKFLR